MGVYFSLLFGLLAVEMCVLFIMSLPLGLRVRKGLYNQYETLLWNSTFQTVAAIVAILVGLLFVDSLNKSSFPVSKNYEYGNNGGITPIQVLASRAYNQRNVYISGFILYFGFCIVTIMSLVGRLVKYGALVDGTSKTSSTPEYKALLVELNRTNIELEGLTTQVINFEKHYDEHINAP
ncbi:hypothetical protein TPHA_0N01500 [Tetrapisispora phaffii CBS 4417]|uniref:Endoplasmic reticulum transmembrane protein n=1 Tax=Tetrapisispora phaffii (strain ATCC 24235 / CBS 4417 / NBRC 1672 / NRRL Y-8282 / UCD 70-5) TaxID=1071381 RepID=G8C1A3_TETPH|nr:hypothetical protein TPHA_0N01500 [Tetrapisispora phaffii CBS 4417]CCE65931.1 hypothetical protein TPHA_0N01500 [Tetrapisispora phaffii CBS 4417]